jgi:hypothetical protein
VQRLEERLVIDEDLQAGALADEQGGRAALAEACSRVMMRHSER